MMKTTYRIQDLGVMLNTPVTQPAYAVNICAYQGAELLQLDSCTLLYVAAVAEVGGGDRSVGNQGFVIRNGPDLNRKALEAMTPIDINHTEPFTTREGFKGEAIKYLAYGGVVPLDAVDSKGRPLPAAGKGLLLSHFLIADPKTKQIVDKNNRPGTEVVHVEWNGSELKIVGRELLTEIMGLEVKYPGWSRVIPDGQDFIAVLGLGDGMKMAAVRWRHTGRKWEAVERSELFGVGDGAEFEPAISNWKDGYLVHTRGNRNDKGRIYFSRDLKTFELIGEQRVAFGPACVGQIPDGTAYVVANALYEGLHAYLRNPLYLHTFNADGSLNEPLIIHDEGGMRQLTPGTGSIPFLCHGRGRTVHLDGKWRHLICYRHSDLMDLDLYTFQKAAGLDKQLEAAVGQNPEKGKRIRGGTAMAELFWEGPASVVPWRFSAGGM